MGDIRGQLAGYDSFRHSVDPGDVTQVVRVGNYCLYPWSDLSSSSSIIYLSSRSIYYLRQGLLQIFKVMLIISIKLAGQPDQCEQ